MITIPARLKDLIQGVSDEISAAVGIALASVSPVLERNEAPFFSDYTDHGVRHIENVLKTCELLIADKAWEVFTREDSAVLVLATLSHDLGMLISVDGFRYLVDSRRDSRKIQPDDQPWHRLWREFQLEARRFDGSRLIKILGSPEPVPIQDLEPDHFSERGMKIAGEFLRRHHHRLSHEIVAFGMPIEKTILPLFQDVPEHLRDLAGIVARSHGLSIRESLEPLVNRGGSCHREHRHIHPPFLMSLVRLSDYLDLDIGRTPASVLASKSLKSPVSRREWWSHRAIVDCNAQTDDPECLQVFAEPMALSDVSTFIMIEEKVAGIQKELDMCWAVLGEVYGRFAPLNMLSLKIRRIRSNLREPSTINQLPFVPFKASVETARADLLKLLIEPLYGDHPGIGIRELIQNAIDAVREMDFILAKRPSLQPGDREEIEGDVLVSFEKDSDGNPWVTVTDRGIGMTWETVCKYYLTAGASFRESDVWKKRFADDEGKSQVLRSGRFGIGVLAAFLLGDRVYVSTRHVEEPENRGIQFEFGLDDTSIEMRWARRKVGSTIRVRTTNRILERLMDSVYWRQERWDWYCLKTPALVRRDIDGKKLKSDFTVPCLNELLPLHWHRITVPGYEAIDWSLRKLSYRHGSALFCNGILIPSANISPFHSTKDFQTHLFVQRPNVSVFDPEGRLPLTLARDRLARTPEDCAAALAEDISRNFIAFCLLRGPEGSILSRDHFQKYFPTEYPNLNRNPVFEYFFGARGGFGLSDPWNISHFSSTPGLLIRINKPLEISKSLADLVSTTYGFISVMRADGTLMAFDVWHRRLVLSNSNECLPAFAGLKLTGFQTLMTNSWYYRFTEKQRKFVVSSTRVQSKTTDWTLWTVGDCPGTGEVLVSIAQEMLKNRAPFESLTELYIDPSTERPAPGHIAQLWQQVVGDPIMPFEKAKREQIIARLGKEFEGHLAEWQMVNQRVEL
jgi:molecular chaperone HtpG